MGWGASLPGGARKGAGEGEGEREKKREGGPNLTVSCLQV